MENLNAMQHVNLMKYMDYINLETPKLDLVDFSILPHNTVIDELKYGVKTCLVPYNIDFELFKVNFEASYLIFQNYFLKLSGPFSDTYVSIQEKAPRWLSFMNPNKEKTIWYHEPLWFYAGFPDVANFGLKNGPDKLWAEFRIAEKNIPEFLFIAPPSNRLEFKFLFFLIDYFKKGHSNGQLALEIKVTSPNC